MMDARQWRRRLTLIAVAVVVVGTLMALPSAAYAAKASTRIVAVKSMTVNRDTPGVNPWPKSLGVKLQKRVSRTRYVALTGTVKLYRYDPMYGPSGGYRLVTSKRGSSVTFSLPGRGKYKLYYAGSSKTKSSSAYTSVYETVGATIGSPTVSITPFDATTSWVNVTYALNWNTEAIPELTLMHQSYFYDDTDKMTASLVYSRDYTAPGVAEFNFKVANTDILDTLYVGWVTWANEYAYRGDYVRTPNYAETEIYP